MPISARDALLRDARRVDAGAALTATSSPKKSVTRPTISNAGVDRVFYLGGCEAIRYDDAAVLSIDRSALIVIYQFEQR
jgi:hypothetical protein